MFLTIMNHSFKNYKWYRNPLLWLRRKRGKGEEIIIGGHRYVIKRVVDRTRIEIEMVI